jgi:integrase
VLRGLIPERNRSSYIQRATATTRVIWWVEGAGSVYCECTGSRERADEAMDQEYLQKNPARKVAMPETGATCKRFLAPDEHRKMLAVLGDRDRLIFRLFVVCAFRPGELFALRWRCFRGRPLLVEEAVYKGKLGAPKTMSSATVVALPDSLVQELTACYERSGCPSADAFIFPSRKGTPISAHNYLRRDVLKPAAKSVGIKGLTFQALRRMFATHFTASAR